MTKKFEIKTVADLVSALELVGVEAMATVADSPFCVGEKMRAIGKSRIAFLVDMGFSPVRSRVGQGYVTCPYGYEDEDGFYADVPQGFYHSNWMNGSCTLRVGFGGDVFSV